MKVFLLKKDCENKKHKLYEKESKIRIHQKEKFNSVIIENCCNSNCICMIENIKVYNRKMINNIGIFEGKNIYNKYRNKYDTVDIFDIYSDFENKEDSRGVQFVKNQSNSMKECNMIEDLMIIVLPKGSLFIKLDEPVLDFKLDIKWTGEKIFE